MKISIAVSIIIFTVTGVLAWSNHREIEGLRGKLARMGTEAAKLGVTLRNRHDPASDGFHTKRKRVDTRAEKLAEVRRFLKEVLGSGSQRGRDIEANYSEQIGSFDEAQLMALLAELAAQPDIEDWEREALEAGVISSMFQKYPGA